MNLKNRVAKLEHKIKNPGAACQCAENSIALSTEVFINPKRCPSCGDVIRPQALLVQDMAEVENFNYPVKVYAGFDYNLV